MRNWSDASFNGVLLMAFLGFVILVSLVPTKSQNPLIAAVLLQDTNEISRLVISSKISVNNSQKHGMTPLMIAAANGKQQSARTLMNLGADMNARDQLG